jgi:hypothetical protein
MGLMQQASDLMSNKGPRIIKVLVEHYEAKDGIDFLIGQLINKVPQNAKPTMEQMQKMIRERAELDAEKEIDDAEIVVIKEKKR